MKILAPQSDKSPNGHPCEVIGIGRPFPISAIGTVARIPVSPWLPFQVALTLQREKFDILHIHEPLIPLLPITVLLTSNTVNVGTFHAFHETPRYYRFGRHYLKRHLPRLQGKIAVSEPAKTFVGHHLPAEYQLIPNGIDTICFAKAEKRPEFNDGKFNILFVGRQEKRKGLDVLLKAYAQARPQLPESRVIIVGSGGKNGNRYQRMVSDLGIKDDTVFAGFISDTELPSFYQSADVFCAPALNGESFGIVLLEAMACGTPVIASNISGYASVLTHESEGLLVAPGKEDALATALLKLAAEPSLRKDLGINGRITAEKYDWENVAARVLSYYHQCRERNRRHR